jgi:hypothetical protein
MGDMPLLAARCADGASRREAVRKSAEAEKPPREPFNLVAPSPVKRRCANSVGRVERMATENARPKRSTSTSVRTTLEPAVHYGGRALSLLLEQRIE